MLAWDSGWVKIKSTPELMTYRTNAASGSPTKTTTGMKGWPAISLRQILRTISRTWPSAMVAPPFNSATSDLANQLPRASTVSTCSRL